jgi:hypothetical protein
MLSVVQESDLNDDYANKSSLESRFSELSASGAEYI